MTSHVLNTSKHITHSTAKISALSFAMLLMQSNTALAAPGSLVQLIDNVANASYTVNDQTNLTLKSDSNKVRVKASEFGEYDIELNPATLQTVAPGDKVYWKNELINKSSNEILNVEISLETRSALSGLQFYVDSNKNGKLDGDEKWLPSGSQIQIKHGVEESIDIIVEALTEASATDGQEAEIKLGATVVEDPSVKKVVTDSLIIVENGIAFTDDTYNETQQSSQVGKDIYIKTSFAQCNLNATGQDYVWVTVTSAKTGDSVKLKALEIEQENIYNTGKYQLLVPTQNNTTKIADDGIIQTLDGDTLTATNVHCINPESGLEISAPELSTTIDMISPAGLVVEKTSEVRTAELGDYVNYTIKVSNNGKSTA